MDQHQILSVCTGIGGLDLGLHEGLRSVGIQPRTVCMVEREAFAAAVLAQKVAEGLLDECPLWLGDLRDLPVNQLPAIDWITGGYPCQPFSYAGSRLGADDPRHLWPVIHDFVRTLRPTGVFFENVGGHLTLGLDQVLRDLAESGFRCAFGLFTAQEVGAPHRRERVFILGLADSNSERLERREGRKLRKRSGKQPAESGCSSVDDSNSGRHMPSDKEVSARRNSFIVPSWWSTEPDVGRVADGVSSRVDRLRALGNAVVPQQAAHAFKSLWRILRPEP